MFQMPSVKDAFPGLPHVNPCRGTRMRLHTSEATPNVCLPVKTQTQLSWRSTPHLSLPPAPSPDRTYGKGARTVCWEQNRDFIPRDVYNFFSWVEGFFHTQISYLGVLITGPVREGAHRGLLRRSVLLQGERAWQAPWLSKAVLCFLSF